MGKRLEIKCRLFGKRAAGKYTPPKIPETKFINQVIGSPLLKIMINAPEIMPMLIEEITVSIRIIKTAKKFGFTNFTPKKHIPNNRQTKAFNELKIKSQQGIQIIILDTLVGVTNIASKVPIICSSLTLIEKVFNDTDK